MDGNKRNFFKKRPNNQFKRKGVNKKGKWNHSFSYEQSSGNSESVETVYRILCPSRKIGGVIGKSGSIVKALREETKAKITVADSVPGSDERVILIYSSPKKISRRQSDDEDSAAENEQEVMEPHCAAQDALLKVHDRIIKEDLFGGMASDDDNENTVVTARLLVPNNMVGCLLGKRGDVIQKLRSETGANIRVLPAEHLPACAMRTDELVQISGKPNVTKVALYEVSTLLHQNPRKDRPPLNFAMPFGGPGLHPRGSLTNVLPPGNPMWSHGNSSSHGMPPMQWMGGYADQPSGVGPRGFNGVLSGHGVEASVEFSMKIMCSAGKIGGVIGKGGFNVKQLQQETGASIHVEDAFTDSDERIIRVSALEALWNPRSQTIEAVLQLQSKTSEFSEKGLIITRLLVPSSKVGCILGQGGHVINEMRRRTQADIRVYSKDDKPKCAFEDEELVQISGNFAVAKEALSEIASRLRVRTLQDGNAGVESAPVRPVYGFGPTGSVPGKGHPLSGATRAGSSGGYEHLRGGGGEYDPHMYPVPPAATRYPNMNSALERKIPSGAVDSHMGAGGSSFPSMGEVAVAGVKLQDPQLGGNESIFDQHGSSEHLPAAQNILQAFMTAAVQPMVAQHSSYQDLNTHQGSYQNMNVQRSPYQNMNTQESPYPNVNAQQSPYDNTNAQRSPYTMSTQQGAYANINSQQSAYYNNIGA